MVRPIAEFLFLVFPALYIFRGWIAGERTNFTYFKHVAACVIAFVIVAVPWMMRNERIFGSFELSPLGGHNLLTNNVRGFLAWRALLGTAGELPAILAMRHVNDPVFRTVARSAPLRILSCGEYDTVLPFKQYRLVPADRSAVARQ